MHHKKQDLKNALHRARKTVTEDDIATAIGGDRTAVSRVFSDQYGVKLSRIEALLALLGYRAIPIAKSVREVPESDYQALVTMAGMGQRGLLGSDIHVRHACAEDGERRKGDRRSSG